MSLQLRMLMTAFVVFIGLTVMPVRAQDYDLVILNGRVMDINYAASSISKPNSTQPAT